MRLFILFLFALSTLIPLGCDKPLVIDQGDNIAAIQLSTSEENGMTVLEWTPINHPGFNKYWLVRVPDSSFLVTDSIDFLNLQILHQSTDNSQNRFIDDIPLLGDGDYYQLYADVNGRLVSSNEVLSGTKSFAIPYHLTFSIITGDNGKLFMALRDLLDGSFLLGVYDVTNERMIKTVPIEPSITSRSRIAYGDFGTGRKEIAITNGGSEIFFYDPENLTINHSQTLSSSVLESMTCLPGIGLAFLQLNGSQLSLFSRKNNQFSPPFSLPGSFSSRNSFIERVKGKNEIVISVSLDRLHRISYDQTGNFNSLAYERLNTTNSNISTDLSVDPLGEYVLPSRFGEMFRLSDFSPVTQFPGESSPSGFRTWAFINAGSRIMLASSTFPSSMFIYDRSDLSLAYSGTIPSTMVLLNTVVVDDEDYLIIQKNTEPFETIFSRL